MSEKLLTLSESAAMLNVKYPRAAELVRLGLMPGVVRLGRQIRIDPIKLHEFIQEGGRALPGGWRRGADGGTAA